MEYYCIMVRTGEEEAFKKNAMACLKENFPDVQFFFFQRMMKTNKGECFERPLLGLEGNIYMVNKKRKRITITSSLSPYGKHFDLFYEDVEVLE